MTTDEVPPISDEMPTVAPEQPAVAKVDDAGTHAGDSGYRQPAVDVDALRVLLDGRYREVRELVRANLAEHAQILLDQEQMSTADFRERVKDVVVMMAETGQTGMGFPEAYGGGGDIGASIAAFETSRSATSRCWSRSACSSACSAARSCSSARSRTTTPTSPTS